MFITRDEVLSLIADSFSRVIHDYNNVIGAIDGYTVLLLSELKDEVAIEDVKEISNIVLKSAKIRNKLSIFYRKVVQGKEYIDINEIINKKAMEYLDKSSVELNLSKDIKSIYAKNDEIELMITELFENAVYHSKKENTEIRVKTYNVEKDIIIEFEDNGIGIDEENVDRVFFPFFTTVQNNLKDGLGLSWIWGIARRHNAEVILETKKNIFTRFIIKFKNINLKTET